MGQTVESATRYHSGISEPSIANEARTSGVSWAAVIAGAFVVAALSLILLALGAGLGFSSVSIWSNVGASAIGMATVLWLIVMQIISSSMGGYLAGRLRTQWANIHTDEVYFRDTAHGFLAWAVALVITAAFLASAATSMVGSAASSSSPGTGVTPGVKPQVQEMDPDGYFVDMLFRSDSAKPDANDALVRGEGGRILANALRQKEIPTADKNYLSQLVATRTGLTNADAEKRVSDVFKSAQQAGETTRKTVAHSLLWVFLALLIGAFCASVGATIGGRQRDHVVVV
jgi:hypothetical protein